MSDPVTMGLMLKALMGGTGGGDGPPGTPDQPWNPASKLVAGLGGSPAPLTQAQPGMAGMPQGGAQSGGGKGGGFGQSSNPTATGSIPGIPTPDGGFKPPGMPGGSAGQSGLAPLMPGPSGPNDMASQSQGGSFGQKLGQAIMPNTMKSMSGKGGAGG